jgi:hypothetical protein
MTDKKKLEHLIETLEEIEDSVPCTEGQTCPGCEVDRLVHQALLKIGYRSE